jgi:hypothetical protein
MRTFSDFIQDRFFTTSLNGFIFTQSFYNMIERIYFQSIIFSQKEMGSKKHKADVVLPVSEVEGIDNAPVKMRHLSIGITLRLRAH